MCPQKLSGHVDFELDDVVLVINDDRHKFEGWKGTVITLSGGRCLVVGVELTSPPCGYPPHERAGAHEFGPGQLWNLTKNPACPHSP